MPIEIDIPLSYEPREWQLECHEQKKRFSVFALHRRAGKTELAIQELIFCAVGPSKFRERLYIYMAPLLKQAKLIAWDRLKSAARQLPGAQINESELCIKLGNGAEIRVLGGDNPDAARGVRIDGIIIDEVAQVKPEVWNEIVQPAMSDRAPYSWAIFIGTPKGINMFSELYNRALTLPDWHAALYTVYDTDALLPEEVERLKRDMPDNEFRREYLCDFSAAAENQLVSVGEVEDAAKRHLRIDEYTHAPLVMGVDPARFGDDSSVIVFRQGLHCEPPITFHGIDNMRLAAACADQITQRTPDAVFIDAGAGSGVIDRLRQLGMPVVEVAFGGRATDQLYYNKRTEMWFAVKHWIAAGGALPNSMRLKQDIATPTYEFNAKGQYVLESKDDIKARILRSPDEADALALTFAFPAQKSLGFIHPNHARSKNSASVDYDPLERV